MEDIGTDKYLRLAEVAIEITDKECLKRRGSADWLSLYTMHLSNMISLALQINNSDLFNKC